MSYIALVGWTAVLLIVVAMVLAARGFALWRLDVRPQSTFYSTLALLCLFCGVRLINTLRT